MIDDWSKEYTLGRDWQDWQEARQRGSKGLRVPINNYVLTNNTEILSGTRWRF